MSEDTDVMFRIGVMDHPASRTALQELASAVEAAQARMTAGVESIGEAASRVGGMVNGLTGNLERMQGAVSHADMESVRYASGGVRGPDYVPSAPASSTTTQRSQPNTNELSRSMQNVFSELGTEHLDQMDSIIEAVEQKLAELPSAVKAQSEVLRSAYASQMVEHSEAYAAMAQDLDGFLAKNGSTVEQIAANLRKGEASLQRYRDAASTSSQESNKMFVESALHVAQMAKGLATIGLVSEENAQKFMQALAVIQGTFDVLKGGIEAYEKFGRGIQKAREAEQLLAKAKSASAALETAQVVRLRAYHAALVQEAAAANTAAAANSRLAASRTAAGASATAGAAGSVASGIGDAIGGAGMMGRLGRMGGLGRVGGMALRASPVVMGAAALGTIGYQNATGASTTSDSSVMATTMKTNAWLLRLTGQFEKLDSPANKLIDSVTGFMSNIGSMTGSFDSAQVPGGVFASTILDARGLAASQAGVERGQKSLDQNRINNDAKREIELAALETQRQKDRLRFGNSVDRSRARAEAETSSFGFQDLAGDREAERRNAFNRMKMRSVRDEGALGAATLAELSGNATRMRARPSEADGLIKGETEVYTLAVSKYAQAKAELDKTLAFAGSTEADRENAMRNATFYQDKMLDSINRQAQLARSSGAERLNIEREIQSAALQAIDQQQAKLDALNERRKSAMKSFVDMDSLERSMATKALEKARTGGAASLTKTETDLLGRVNTDETNRFVDQATEAQAKKLGFENTFGTGIEATRKQIEGTRQQLEAQLQASFDVSVKVEADTEKVVNAIMPYFDKAIDDMTKAIEQSVDEKMTDKVAAVRLEAVKNAKLLRQ